MCACIRMELFMRFLFYFTLLSFCPFSSFLKSCEILILRAEFVIFVTLEIYLGSRKKIILNLMLLWFYCFLLHDPVQCAVVAFRAEMRHIVC